MGVRETVERLRELDVYAGPDLDHGVPVFWQELSVLLDIAEATLGLVRGMTTDDAPWYADWWCDDGDWMCWGCHLEHADPYEIPHAPDCPAIALGRALAALGGEG